MLYHAHGLILLYLILSLFLQLFSNLFSSLLQVVRFCSLKLPFTFNLIDNQVV